jgi:hypothetical protein
MAWCIAVPPQSFTGAFHVLVYNRASYIAFDLIVRGSLHRCISLDPCCKVTLGSQRLSQQNRPTYWQDCSRSCYLLRIYIQHLLISVLDNTVGTTDSRLVYRGSWTNQDNGAWQLTSDTSASVSLTFAGWSSHLTRHAEALTCLKEARSTTSCGEPVAYAGELSLPLLVEQGHRCGACAFCNGPGAGAGDAADACFWPGVKRRCATGR